METSSWWTAPSIRSEALRRRRQGADGGHLPRLPREGGRAAPGHHRPRHRRWKPLHGGPRPRSDLKLFAGGDKELMAVTFRDFREKEGAPLLATIALGIADGNLFMVDRALDQI